jgi:hypothetical protein
METWEWESSPRVSVGIGGISPVLPILPAAVGVFGDLDGDRRFESGNV